MVVVRRPPPKRPEPAPRPVKRRTDPPREPRIRKSGFRPFLKAASGKVGALRAETFAGQYYSILAFVVIMGLLSAAGVWLAREAEYRGQVALAAYQWCAEPRPLSHMMACDDFNCLAKVNEDNARFVRICHPEALRS